MNTLRIILAIPLAIGGIYFGIRSITNTFDYASKINAEDKISGAKVSTISWSKSIILFVFASLFIFPDIQCVAGGLFILGGFWFNYWIYKTTLTYLDKR